MPMRDITERYDKQRGALPPRDYECLTRVVRLGQTANLQMLRCARAFKIKTLPEIAKLRKVLTSAGIAHDVDLLSALASYKQDVNTLSAVSELSVVQLLSEVSHPIGSEEWADMLKCLFSIEHQVHFLCDVKQQLEDRRIPMAQVGYH